MIVCKLDHLFQNNVVLRSSMGYYPSSLSFLKNVSSSCHLNCSSSEMGFVKIWYPPSPHQDPRWRRSVGDLVLVILEHVVGLAPGEDNTQHIQPWAETVTLSIAECQHNEQVSESGCVLCVPFSPAAEETALDDLDDVSRGLLLTHVRVEAASEEGKRLQQLVFTFRKKYI